MSVQQSILIIKKLSAEVLAQQAERKLSSSRDNIIKVLRQRRSLKTRKVI